MTVFLLIALVVCVALLACCFVALAQTNKHLSWWMGQALTNRMLLRFYAPVKPLSEWRGASGVYVIECCGLCKIGYASDVAGRLGTYTTAIPMGYQICAVILTHRPSDLEQVLHQRFAASRVRGEWFNLAFEDTAYLQSLANEPRRAARLLNASTEGR